MIKKSLFLVLISSLSACSTYYEAKNCDPDKNYIKSNPAAIENYKKLVAEGAVRSFYLKIISPVKCTANRCLDYNLEINDFFELYIDDNKDRGIFTIQKRNTVKCLDKSTFNNNSCITILKNENNIIRSRYSMEIFTINNTTYKKFTDLEKNVVLFEMSYQYYHKPSVSGEPNGDMCEINYNNNTKYKFDSLAFPIR